MYRELLIGCGIDRKKLLQVENRPKEWQDLTTLDMSTKVEPDVVWDLNKLPYPFEDSTFDEIHAYEVLEHFGTQGNAEEFFAHFIELARILKPNGILCGSTPTWDGVWAWGDPGHRRIINEGTLVFLDQTKYGKPPMTDYRDVYKADLRCVFVKKETNRLFFILENYK